MKRAARLLARLYPAAWKRRYGAEFDALLDDHSPTWRSLANVLLGAFKMQLTNWNFVKIVTATAALGAVGAAAGSFAITKTYRSMAVIRVTGSDSPQVIGHALTALQQKVLSIRSLTKISETAHVEQSIDGMRKRIRVKVALAENRPLAFSVEFDYRNPEKARHAVELLVIAMMDQAMINRFPARLDIVDPASTPSGPIGPNRLAFAGFGLLAGIGTGVLLIVFRRIAGGFRRLRSTPDETS